MAPAYGTRRRRAALATMAVGMAWWIISMILALGYFVFIYRKFRGKVKLEAADEGY